MSRLIGAVVMAVASFAAQASAESPVLNVATGDYPPFTDQTAPDGGVINASVQAVAVAAGFDVVFDYMPWMRALEMARSGRFQATSYWFYNAEREADFIHVGPVNTDRLVLFHRAGETLPDWSDLTDLDGLTIGAVSGYTYTEEFWDLAEAGIIDVNTAQSDEANFRKILSGRIDIYPMSEVSGRLLLEDRFTPEERAAIGVHPVSLMETDGYLLVSRQMAGAEDVAQRLQSALDARTARLN